MKLWYLIPLILVAGCITDSAPLTGLATVVPGTTFEDPEPVPVSLGINNGNSIRVDMITVPQGTTALEAFREIADVETREANYAKYVVAIDDLSENPRKNKFWVFYVDNQISSRGAADYVIAESVDLEFRYESMPEHK